MKIYEIETKEEAVCHTMGILEIEFKYRYVSLYNGARGLWFVDKEAAEKQGQKHQDIIERIHLQPMFILNSEDLK